MRQRARRSRVLSRDAPESALPAGEADDRAGAQRLLLHHEAVELEPLRHVEDERAGDRAPRLDLAVQGPRGRVVDPGPVVGLVVVALGVAQPLRALIDAGAAAAEILHPHLDQAELPRGVLDDRPVADALL